jgi:uncharacterized protein YggU (UPF0235/DUF167 family)
MLRVTVVAHPGARYERVGLLGDDTLGVWVRQRPVDGKANAAIRACLANALGLRARQVEIVGGATGRRKIVELIYGSRGAAPARAGASRAIRLSTDPISHGYRRSRHPRRWAARPYSTLRAR